jgi:hypothetical protein
MNGDWKFYQQRPWLAHKGREGSGRSIELDSSTTKGTKYHEGKQRQGDLNSAQLQFLFSGWGS